MFVESPNKKKLVNLLKVTEIDKRNDNEIEFTFKYADADITIFTFDNQEQRDRAYGTIKIQLDNVSKLIKL